MPFRQLTCWVRIGVLFLALSPLAARALPLYSFVDLGTFPGSTFSTASAINSRGDVAGEAGPGIPTLWQRGTITGLVLPQDYGRGAVLANNSSGVSVGVVTSDKFSVSTAAKWSHDGTVNLLEGVRSVAFAVNGAGYVAGEAGPTAALWSPTGSLQGLGALGGRFSDAFGINNNGIVVGVADLSDTVEHAFRWDQAGGMQDLGTLPGFNLSDARAINNRGDIVGGVSQPRDDLGSTTFRAFIWTREEGMQDLGWITGAEGLRAFSINDRGEAVGIVRFPDGHHDGFVYDPTEGLALLSSLTRNLDGWTIQETHQINDRGQIVGKAVYLDGTTHAFELVPHDRSIPEPSTILLVLEACAVALLLTPPAWHGFSVLKLIRYCGARSPQRRIGVSGNL